MERYLKFLPPSYDDYYESDMFLFSVVEILCQLHNQYMLTFLCDVHGFCQQKYASTLFM